jgi:hypothetical protein
VDLAARSLLRWPVRCPRFAAAGRACRSAALFAAGCSRRRANFVLPMAAFVYARHRRGELIRARSGPTLRRSSPPRHDQLPVFEHVATHADPYPDV